MICTLSDDYFLGLGLSLNKGLKEMVVIVKKLSSNQIFCLYFQDYFEIVRNPMDLSTIKRKLDAGQYNNPWEVCMGLNDQLVFITEWVGWVGIYVKQLIILKKTSHFSCWELTGVVISNSQTTYEENIINFFVTFCV